MTSNDEVTPGSDEAAVMHTVGANVRVEIFRAGRTQDDVAALLHIGQSSLSRRLSGEVPFRIHELVLISRALGVPVAAFLEGVR